MLIICMYIYYIRVCAAVPFYLPSFTRGFIAAVECFRERDERSSGGGAGTVESSVVHDLTVAYDDYTPGERPSEMSLFTGDLICVFSAMLAFSWLCHCTACTTISYVIL
jgi:hypothetical protein